MHKSRKFMLVYQAGLANVFCVESFTLKPEGRNALRILQTDFSSAQVFCHGVTAGGGEIRVAGLNEAGNIADRVWTADRDSLPFRDQFGDFMLQWMTPEEEQTL